MRTTLPFSSFDRLISFPLLFISFATLLATLFLGCRPNVPTYTAQKSEIYSTAAIAGPHPLATEVGEMILKKGGNAIDAAVAVQFAMAVCYPRAGNLGGGGFLVYRAADGDTRTLDYREKAPAAASRDMYLDDEGEVISDLSTLGHLAVGVPGTVAGIEAMFKEYGSLPWPELIEPAIQLARNGYRISQSEADRLNGFQEYFAQMNEQSPWMGDTFLVDQVIVQTELAATLVRIQENGSQGFYQGETARLITKEMEENGGLITAQDLKNYTATWRDPVTANYDNYRIISMPPSSSGGVALTQLLGMVEPYALDSLGFQSAATAQLMVEAERRAYADRAEYLGDSDFYPVPIGKLTDEAYLSERMADFSPDSAGTSADITAGAGLRKESFETTHISIIDSLGNAVSITTTLNGNFGSKVIVDGAGFFLNNEMDDFSAKPGVPNMFGLVGAEANAIAPGKRMLSSMTPTIVEKDGELFMVLGAPGGSTIITAVFQTFLNVAEFGMSLDEAVNAPRFHHQWLPDEIMVEPDALGEQVKATLAAKGYRFRDVGRMAVVKALQVLPDGRLHAVGDGRNPDDDVAGY
ncbi:gamma-glutamyltransferase [Lewinellaceae bacterium SD302]|nr:gamma-glutamyltransferase [Lewinellaceae bacterium SD302]